jgi:hypothetical protein
MQSVSSGELRVERTNFEDGSWDDICSHCGQKQEVHRQIWGPDDGVLYEHRMPCEQEKATMQAERRKIVLVGWILLPLVWLLLQQFVAVVGWIAFGSGIIMLAITTVKHFGNPDKWIPGHKRKMDEEREHSHFIWHCKRNPEGFERLRTENFKRMERERENERAKSALRREQMEVAERRPTTTQQG